MTSWNSLKRLSLGNLILALEADLDSLQLQLQPRYYKNLKFPKDVVKIRAQIRRCLAAARILQAKFPQEDYTINRCHYKDELPGQPMGEAKKNWNRFKANQKARQELLK